MTQVLGTERRNIPRRQPSALCPGLPRVGEARAENDVGETEVISDLNQRVLTPRKVGGSGVQRGWGVGTFQGVGCAIRGAGNGRVAGRGACRSRKV